MKSRTGRCHRSRGSAAVELALVLLCIAPLLAGLVSFGRAVQAWDTLARSVRAAARHLSVGPFSDPAWQWQARCLAVTGSPATTGAGCAAPPLLPGLSPQMVTIIEPASTPAMRQVLTGVGSVDLLSVSIESYSLPVLGTPAGPSIPLGRVSVTLTHGFF